MQFQYPLRMLQFSASHVKNRMLYGLGAALLMALIGCGDQLHASPAPQGVYIDSVTIQFLQTQFDQAKSCSQLPKGTFNDLSVVMMPPSFPCPYYSIGCSGEFANPNIIKVGMFSAWKHEVIHYLLYVNTGDSDTNHTSPFFQTCTK